MARKRFCVSWRVIAELLNLPHGTEIEDISVDEMDSYRKIITVVVDDNMPSLMGSAIENVTPVWRTYYQKSAQFVSWNSTDIVTGE